MTDNDNHNEVNKFNSIDLNDLYNLNRCLGGVCVSNMVPESFPTRTIEQIVMDPYINTERGAELLSAADDAAYANSSPIFGNPAQMYMPITKTQSELYPTPAVVQEEIESKEKQLSSEPDSAEELFLPYEVTRESLQYLNGFIRTQIGRRVTIDFLLGSDTLTSKTGYLLAVAQNYLLLNELDTNDVTACDLYTMKFIRFYY